MITIDYKDRRPIYEQIKNGLKRLIVTGALKEGDKLPSVRSLATELAINPNTIQKAYNELENAGVIYAVKGKGNFVADDAAKLKEEKLRALLDALAQQVIQAMELGATEEQLEQWLRQTIQRRKGGEKA